MSSCPLTSQTLHRLLAKALNESEQRELFSHFETDCTQCDRVLDAEGLDTETLLLYVLAASDEQLSPQQQGRSWAKISAAWEKGDAPQYPEQKKPRWTHLVSWVFGAGSLAAVAAALLLVLVPATDPETTGLVGVKGAADLPRVHLELRAPGGPATQQFSDGDVVEITHGIERGAHVLLFHWQSGLNATPLFAGMVQSATRGRGRFAVAGGLLGYRFENEPGLHLFVAVICASAVNETAAIDTLDRRWFSEAQGPGPVIVAGQQCAIETIRADVKRANDTP